MRIYYLDKPLNEEELKFVKQALCEREGLQSIQVVEQIRVPTVLPIPGKEKVFEEDVAQRTRLAMKNLFRAGLKKDIGSQVTRVMPKETHWGAVFELAIYEVTGFAPYVVQRWRYDGNHLVKGPIRLIDGHGMIGGKY